MRIDFEKVIGILLLATVLVFVVNSMFDWYKNTKGVSETASATLAVALSTLITTVMIFYYTLEQSRKTLGVQITLDSISKVQKAEENLLAFRYSLTDKKGNLKKMSLAEKRRYLDLELLLLNAVETFCTLVNSGYVKEPELKNYFGNALVVWRRMIAVDFPEDDQNKACFPELKKMCCQCQKNIA